MGTYGYISIIAMFCYVFMLLTFLAAKKDKLVNSFLVMLVGLMCWTGGSVFMRSLMWPNYIFWYHVSLLGILLLPYAYYLYINALGGIRERWVGKIYILVMLFCFLINIPGGIILKYPSLVEENGTRSFVYSMDLKVSVFFLVAAVLILHMFVNVMRVCKANPNMRRQYEPLVLGVVVLFAGNLLIGLPVFDGFPVDILGGLLNAFLLLYALIRRRLFRLQMLASAGLCYGVGILLSCVLFFIMTPYLERLLQAYVPVTDSYYPLLFAALFLLAYLGVTFLWKLLVNNVFVKEELHQAEKLKMFSTAVSKTLHLQEIMDETGLDADSLVFLHQGNTVQFGGSRAEILWPERKTESEYIEMISDEENENDMSMIIKIYHRNMSALITGDIDETLMNTLAELHKHDSQLQSDILKVPHHGSKYSWNEEFIDKVSPEYAVIQSGRNNYGHPAPEIVENYFKKNIKVLRNDQQGAVGFFENNNNEVKAESMK